MGKEDDIGIEDIFVNFAEIEVTSHATLSQTVQEGNKETGLAPSGDRAWAIHSALFRFGARIGKGMSAGAADAVNSISLALGKPGLTLIHKNGTPSQSLVAGVLASRGMWYGQTVGAAGEAAISGETELLWTPSTPVPYAAKSISLYVFTGDDLVSWRGLTFSVRIEFTYIPATPALYLELAQRYELVA